MLEIKRSVSPTDNICEACLNGKQARLRFEKFKNKEHINWHLFVIYSDVCGPITPTTIDDKNYYVIFVDQFTHYCVTYLIKHKSDVYNIQQLQMWHNRKPILKYLKIFG